MGEDGDTEIIATNSIALMAGAEADSQVATAKRYPMHSTPEQLKRFQGKVEAAVLSNEDVAAECFYRLERFDKKENKKVFIEGPSIRFAEVIASFWGNLRIDSGVADIGDKYATAYGGCWDLESNVAERFSIKRRITTSAGKRYSEDMATTNANAARSIAKREAVLKVIPKILWEPIWERARELAVGSSTDLPDKQQKLAGYFKKIGVSLDRVLAKVGRASLAELTLEDVFTLKSVASAIKNGEAILDEEFPPLPAEGAGNPDQTKGDAIAASVEEMRKKHAAAGNPQGKEQLATGQTNLQAVTEEKTVEPEKDSSKK